MNWDAVDAVDWETLGEPRVPKILRNLISDNEDLRTEAYLAFEKLILFREAGWQAFDANFGIARFLKTDLQIMIVPFLIQLLNETNVVSQIALQLFY